MAEVKATGENENSATIKKSFYIRSFGTEWKGGVGGVKKLAVWQSKDGYCEVWQKLAVGDATPSRQATAQ